MATLADKLAFYGAAHGVPVGQLAPVHQLPDGSQYFTWAVEGLEAPTDEDLAAITPEAIDAARTAALKARYAAVRDGLRTTDPKFDLVMRVCARLGLAAGLSGPQVEAMFAEEWNGWAEAGSGRV